MDCINFFSLSLLLAFDMAISATRSSSRILSIGAVLVHLLKLRALALVRYSSPSLSSEIKQQARALVLLLVDVEDIHNGPEP